MQKPRPVEHTYDDPLTIIWLRTAQRLKMRIQRSSETYASWDGKDTLILGLERELDEDDSIAQMVLHEVCHALIEGETGQGKQDWGLENIDDRDEVREFACLRLQAALTRPYGLHEFLAPTTDWRWYYDRLPTDPLRSRKEPAAALARSGHLRAQAEPWRSALEDALGATRNLACLVQPFASDGSLWTTADSVHPTGRPLRAGTERCGSCGWAYEGGPGPRVTRCRQHDGERIQSSWGACDLWEAPLTQESCGTCGACCRDGYHLVEVGPRTALAKRRPDLLTRDQHGLHLARPAGRCVALCGSGTDANPVRCTVYDLRPRSCRDFPVGGGHCLAARRRVGLSPDPTSKDQGG